MPHFRPRHAKALFDNLKAFSPLVGVFGHRQVGKTTFLEQVCNSYSTFDDRATLAAAKIDAPAFLRAMGRIPAGIDECQLCEDLFPALKEHVRKHKQPGQIVLSGSVRFYSRQAIRESLTGRIASLDMLPLVLTELCQLERARIPLKLMEKESFGAEWESEGEKKAYRDHRKAMDTYLEQGGLPGICFMRNEKLRVERIREQLTLLLDRDLRLVYPSSVPFTQILDYVSNLAMSEGEPVQTTRLRKNTGISEVTQKRLLYALENIFVLRQFSIEGNRKGVCIYFEDQGEHGALLEGKADPLKEFEGLVYRNLRASFFYETGLGFRFFQFRDTPDVRIPFAVRSKIGCLGILPILENAPTRKHLRMAHRFLQRYSPATVLVVTNGVRETRVLEPRILQIPAERLLFEP